jgi:uncharacterized membrane protein YbhN (UPF0104 family)
MTKESAVQLVHDRLRAFVALGQRVEKKAPRAIAYLRAVYYPLALLLVGYMGFKAAQEAELAEVRWGALVAAVFAALLWWVCLARGWASLVTDGSPQAVMATWCRTQVARYLPGGIWHVAARAATVDGRVRDKLGAVTAENMIVLLVALGIGGGLASVYDWRWLPLVVLLAAPLFASSWLHTRTRLSRSRIRRTTACYVVGYLAYAAVGVLVQVAVSGLGDLRTLAYVAGAACVAWAVGLVVVVAPGGVGVRELVYIGMLSGIYPTIELQEAAVTSRLVTVLAEFGVLALISRPRRNNGSGDDSQEPEPESDRRSPQLL